MTQKKNLNEISVHLNANKNHIRDLKPEWYDSHT